MVLTGTLQKLKAVLKDNVEYTLVLGEEKLELNTVLGNTLHFDFTGHIFCTHCGKKTKKSYQQGYCYICASTLARCDMCMVRPEKCHFHLNTCREPDWAKVHCHIPHIIYLANTSGLKVGITRKTQIPTRWIDQGATQALPIAEVSSRYLAGQIEVNLAKYVADKTDWRAMLRAANQPLDLHEKYQTLKQQYVQESVIETLGSTSGSMEWLTENSQALCYPVLAYPEKVISLKVENEPKFASTLMGIKGQYLILEKGVLNIRNLTGYEVTIYTQ